MLGNRQIWYLCSQENTEYQQTWVSLLNCFRSYITYSSHLLHFVRGVGLLVPTNIRATTRRYGEVSRTQITLCHAMPQSGNFAIQAKSLFQSSLNLHFLFGASRFFTGRSGPSSYIPRMWKTAPEIILSTLAIIQSESAILDIRIHRSPTENSAPDVFNDLIWGPWLRVVVESWGLGFWVVLTLTVTLTQTTTQTLTDHNPPN